MPTLTTRLFGSVEIAADGAYVRRENGDAGRAARPSLFVGEGLSAADLLRASQMIDALEDVDVEARKAIAVDAARGADGVVAAFIDFHFDELDDETVEALFGDTNREDALGLLQLVGIGVHADKGLLFVVDYSFGEHLTNELIAVKLDARRNVLRVSHES